MNVPTESLRDRLKSETRDRHLALEAVVPLGRPDLDRETCRRHLGRMYGFVEPLEGRLRRVAELGVLVPDLDRRWRAGLLEQDLGALGVDVGALPRCVDLPPTGSVGEALGCLYVLEGSTLGGQVLRRQLQVVLPDLQATRWIGGHGAETGAMWGRFCRVLEAYRGEPEPVIAAAAATFSTLHRWLEP